MLILAVETATEAAGVALADDGGVAVAVSVPRGRRHAETVTPAVEFACRRAGVALADIDAVAVDVGPGLFTGLRVGIATAKGLGFALGCPLVTASSLEVLAHAGADVIGSGLIVPVVDARRGEVFTARLRSGRDGVVAEGPEELLTPDDLAARLEGVDEPVLLVGDGALRYRDLLESAPTSGPPAAGAPTRHVAGPLLAHPPVAVLARLGLARLAAGAVHDPGGVSPRYLRPADARINWEQRLPPAR